MKTRISEPCTRLQGHDFKELMGRYVRDEDGEYGEVHNEWCKNCGALLEVLQPFDEFGGEDTTKDEVVTEKSFPATSTYRSY